MNPYPPPAIGLPSPGYTIWERIRTLRLATDVTDEQLRDILDEVVYVVNSIVSAQIDQQLREMGEKHEQQIVQLRDECDERIKAIQLEAMPTVDQIADALPNVSTFSPPANDCTDTEERLIIADWLRKQFERSVKVPI